jgi:hypothetical protein
MDIWNYLMMFGIGCGSISLYILYSMYCDVQYVNKKIEKEKIN